MFHIIIARVRSDARVRWMLGMGAIIQVLTALAAIGTYHPDQHFKVVELGLSILGRPNGGTALWEVDAHMLPSLTMYGFAGYVRGMEFLHLSDHYSMLTLLRVIVSLLNLAVFAAIIIYNIPKEKTIALHAAIFLLCFSFAFPYIRTAYSVELLSSTLFFGGCLYFQRRSDAGSNSIGYSLITGLLFGLAFYCRFQIAFAGIGFIAWVLLIQKDKWKNIALIAIAFLAVAAFNTWLDTQFYHQLTITPERYYHLNITEGKAASFGTASPLFYIGILAAILLAPPFSIYLFATTFRPLFTRPKNLYVLCTFVFLVAHFMVSHKEDRFLFPIFGLLPLLSGWALEEIKPVYETRPGWLKGLMKGTMWFSVGLNTVLLVLFLFVPYAQGIQFGKQVHDRYQTQATPTTVYCLERHPYLTESKNHMVWYHEALNKNVEFITVGKLKPLADSLAGKPFVLLTTYNDLHRDSTDVAVVRALKPSMTSTGLLWSLNEFLGSKGANTINEIWALYEIPATR